jgi:hypothetical protein
MSTDIYSGKPGRTIGNYDLLGEVMDTYDLDRQTAHDSIRAFLDQLTDIDGGDTIIASTPVRPELLVSNPHDLDIDYWLTVSDETADAIREALAAAQDSGMMQDEQDEREYERQLAEQGA